ncbi:MAG: phage terminase large subunit [Candidatus Promineofilum sp.]|uniref:phage terminase large subunit n=1 Tax=Promineifilum sp. TaxID=2664178 RepID=UPI002411A909|nr:phage terminase large subunit [Promineifilum sp.]
MMANPHEALATAARVRGCPPDQLRNFLAAGYVPQPKQLEFHAAARACDDTAGLLDQVGFGGARGPGKSHASFAQLALDDCRRFPELKALYLRKIGKQAREQFDDLRRKVLAYVPHDYNRASGIVTLWEGSRIFLGHFKDEKDVDNYLGLEYEIIAIEEATTLSLLKYRTLRDSNRSARADFKPRIYGTTNPGGVGHQWFKRTFVEPARLRNETTTRFVPATVDDNVFVDAGYKRRLEENTGWRLRAYRYGDWDIVAGQYFTTFRHDVHVVRAWESVPRNWHLWGGFDYGFTHPTAFYLLGQDSDGTAHVIDEHRMAKWLPPRHAAAIHAMLERHGFGVGDLAGVYAGADVFAQKGDRSGQTIAEQYEAEGLTLRRANMDRINGAAAVLRRLGDPEKGQPARLQIWDRCPYLIECLPILEHDPHRPEDVLKVDVDEDGEGGDDAYDALRYGLMAAPRGARSFVGRYA